MRGSIQVWGLLGMIAAIVLFGAPAPSGAAPQASRFPDTSDRLHVFNDQVDLYWALDELIAFVATHYDGTQKIPFDQARRVRAVNPDFTVLHYRLGYGLGYRVTEGDCQPSGEYLTFMNGLDWVQEWPQPEPPEEYFYHYNGQRVYMCDWGWYVMDTDHPGYRTWWLEQVRAQLAQGEYDGLFADSVSIPNFIGGRAFRPILPDLDEAFEADWTRRLNEWMDWLNAELGDSYLLIPNAGAWVTTRDQTDYARADGVMIEGFVGWGWSDRFPLEDWALQLDRMLSLINQDKIVIAQNYVEDFPDRLWLVANYLLIKGSHTYLNIDTGLEAEWFPLYDLPVGAALDPVPAQAADLFDSASGLYIRRYAQALVLVNPDPSSESRTFALDSPLILVTGEVGGGPVPPDANISGWQWTGEPVQTVTVAPGQAAILLQPVPD